MPSFSFGQLGLGAGGGATTDYGPLIDMLSIKEDQLASDGKLSPGDYKLLINQAQSLYTHPGLTPAQRSTVLTKIAGYQKDMSTSQLTQNDDITSLNDDYTQSMASINSKYANDPATFLKGQAAAQVAKIDQLSQAIDTMDASGQDASSHYNELTSTMQDYQDTLSSLDAVNQHAADPTKNSTDYAAYVTTNSQGQITDLKIGKTGSSSGYSPTNGTYGGLQVYGKANGKVDNKNIFKFGNQTFTESSNISTVDGSAQNVLTAGGVGSNGYNVNQPSIDVDPKTVQVQGSIRPGGYVQGTTSGSPLYQMQQDGSYKKIINPNLQQLGVQPGDVMTMPKEFLDSITPQVKQTVDGAAVTPVLPPTTTPNPGAPAPATPFAPTPAGQQAEAAAPARPSPIGAPKVGSPKVTASSSLGGVAQGALNAVGGFFGGLFGGGK